MNVSSPRKSRVPRPKGNQQSGISGLPVEPLIENNSIPKQHVGVEQANQLGLDPEVGRIFSPISKQQTYTSSNIYQGDSGILLTTYCDTDKNPFDLLPEDLFDTSFSEDDILNQPEPNEEIARITPEKIYQPVEGNKGLKESYESEAEESSSQEESSTPLLLNNITYSGKPLEDHPLIKPIAEKWLAENKWTGKKLSRTKSKIARFIRFLIHEKIQTPTEEHILLYYQTLNNDPRISSPKAYISTVRVFFRWAKTFNLYEDITVGIKMPPHSHSPKTKTQRKKWDDGLQINNQAQDKINRLKATITIRDMINAKFLYKHAEYLINGDLVVFKKWVETLDIGSVDEQRKVIILKFAHFLHSENRIAPTQKDIVDYYKNYLVQMGPVTVNKNMISIRRFFAWTAEKNIYPNIAINIYSTKRKPINADDIPILPDEQDMQPIPNPTKPLINKTI